MSEAAASAAKGPVGTCLLLIGDRVVLRANAPPEAEYAMFEIGEIELRASEPGRVREHGYQTTVEQARARLAHLGLSGTVARDFESMLQPTLADAYARGLPVRRVARYLGALELFQSDHYDASSHVYRGTFLDLAAMSRDLEVAHASATIHALYLATLLEAEAESTTILLSTDACTKGGKPGARTFKRPSFADVGSVQSALNALAQKNPKPDIQDALPRADVIAFLRSRAELAQDDDARALYRALEGSVSLRDMPDKGPLALPDLWSIETRIDAGDVEGTLDAIDDAERRHGRTPGTTYLRARISLAMRLEPPKLIAERVSALALSMTSFQELALLAAESWLEAGDPRRAMPYARDLVDAPGVDEGLLLRAQRLLARAVGAAPHKKPKTLVDNLQAAQPSRPATVAIADEMARALAVLTPASPLDDPQFQAQLAAEQQQQQQQQQQEQEREHDQDAGPQSLDPQDLVPVLPSDRPPPGPAAPAKPAASRAPPPPPSRPSKNGPPRLSKPPPSSKAEAGSKPTVKRHAVTKGWENDPPPGMLSAPKASASKDKKRPIGLPSSRKFPSATPASLPPPVPTASRPPQVGMPGSLPPPLPPSSRKAPSLGPPQSSNARRSENTAASPPSASASASSASSSAGEPPAERAERLSSIPPLRSKPSAAEVVPNIAAPPLDLDLPPTADPNASSFSFDLPNPEATKAASGSSSASSSPSSSSSFGSSGSSGSSSGPTSPSSPPVSSPKPSRRPRISGVMMETRPPASFDPRAEPDSPMIPRISGVPLDLEASRRKISPVPSAFASPNRSPQSSREAVAAKKRSTRPPPAEQQGQQGQQAQQARGSKPPRSPSQPAPSMSNRPGNVGGSGAAREQHDRSAHERPTPLRPPSNDAMKSAAAALDANESNRAGGAGAGGAGGASFEVTVQASSLMPDRSFMHGASLPPYRHENPPPLLPKAPLLPKLGTSSDELAEHLALPPGLGNDPRASLEALPTSVLEARVQFTLLARELGLDYRLKRGLDLRADMSGIEAMQAVLLETFPDHVVKTSDEAYELRRHGALLSEILARRLDAEWMDISPNELGYWVMIVPPDTRVWPFGRVARLVAMGHKERDLVSYFLELQGRARGR